MGKGKRLKPMPDLKLLPGGDTIITRNRWRPEEGWTLRQCVERVLGETRVYERLVKEVPETVGGKGHREALAGLKWKMQRMGFPAEDVAEMDTLKDIGGYLSTWLGLADRGW